MKTLIYIETDTDAVTVIVNCTDADCGTDTDTGADVVTDLINKNLVLMHDIDA